jgi:hypothetical protein
MKIVAENLPTVQKMRSMSVRQIAANRLESHVMKCSCTLTRLPNGQWLARYTESNLGLVEVAAASKDEVQVKMQNELHYRVELCPCSGVSGDSVVLQIRDG